MLRYRLDPSQVQKTRLVSLVKLLSPKSGFQSKMHQDVTWLEELSLHCFAAFKGGGVAFRAVLPFPTSLAAVL